MAEKESRTDWLHEAKWGVFMHFLAAPASSSQGDDIDADAWNRRVDAFDIAGAARQLRATGARYFVLTLGQNSGHYCCPNATYDRLTGIRPSRCARRDLVGELCDALAPHGIRVMVYLPAGAPEYAPEAVKKLAWAKGGRRAEFQRRWESVICEWSLRWGPKVSGWWFDGCYYNDEMYRHDDEPNFRSFAAAIRAGNPDSLIAWNPGVEYPPVTVDAEEDYTAGEINDPREVDSPGRWERQAQFHMLTYLGRTWGQLPIRFTAEEAIDHTLAFTDYGGVVTWDIPLTYEGHMDPGAFEILKRVGKAVDATRGKPDMTAPKVVRPSVTFTETPSGGDESSGVGRILVALKNHWGERIRGQVAVAIEPASAGQIEGDALVGYDLQSGGGVRAEVRFRLSAARSDAPVRIVLTRTGSERRLTFALPRRERLELPRLAGLPSLGDLDGAMAALPSRWVVNGQGQTLADIKLAVADGQLAILCRATDGILRQTESVWDGSCMEVFGVAEPGDLINQLWLVPATADAPAKALQLERTEGSKTIRILPASGLTFATWPAANGYTSATLIPLAWWLRRPTAPSRFFLEIVVNTGIDSRVFERGALFGSADAPNSTDGYAIVEGRSAEE